MVPLADLQLQLPGPKVRKQKRKVAKRVKRPKLRKQKRNAPKRPKRPKLPRRKAPKAKKAKKAKKVVNRKVQDARRERREKRREKNKGAAERRQKRTETYNKLAAYNKEMRNSKVNKEANAEIKNWIDSDPSGANKKKYRKLMNHLKVNTNKYHHGGHRYTPSLMKELLKKQPDAEVKMIGPGRAQLTISRPNGSKQTKTVFLAAGNYASMHRDLDNVAATDGYSRKKMNALARQGFAQELKNPRDPNDPATAERVVEQGEGLPKITMVVHPPTKGGSGTAYPINRRR
ncbi:hypothetical protein HDU96_007440 [Phlyctochytrium bullatum]|nr:hypothetical protein HDU96_007440 [Phlyctochytrium bullatum]